MERAEANRNGNSAEAGAVLGFRTRYMSWSEKVQHSTSTKYKCVLRSLCASVVVNKYPVSHAMGNSLLSFHG